MISLNFYLKNKKAKRKTLVLVFVHYQKSRIKLSTGLSIDPKHWHNKKQQAKTNMPGAITFNKKLEQIEVSILKLYNQLESQKTFSLALLKRRLLNVKQSTVKQQSINKDFHWFAKKYIAESQTIKSLSTYNKTKNVYQLLCDFETWNGKRIEFENINLDFYYTAQRYFLESRQYSNNYFGAIIKVLKTILNEATERGYNKNLLFKSKKFKRVNEDVDNIYLSRKELEMLYQLDLSKHTQSLNAARDLFLIGCFTGLRFSDMSKLQDRHFIDESYIQIATQKTNDLVVIPLHPYIKAIRQKYQKPNDSGLPSAFANPTMNRLVKVVGQLAGIDQTVSVRKTKGGKRYEITKPKYEFISTHTARRSFATNAFLAGIPPISIMKITGHRTEKAFMSYIKISQEDNARKLVEHAFFNS